MSESLAEKRVAIARDVQAQIVAKAYQFRRHDGFVIRVLTGYSPDLSGSELQGHVDRLAAECRVCQVGALLLSKAKLFNNARVDSRSINREIAYSLLGDIFDEYQLRLLEDAFEGLGSDLERARDACKSDSSRRRWQARIFGRDAARLVMPLYGVDNDVGTAPAVRVWACMNNLISNGGEFIPEQAPSIDGLPEEWGRRRE